MFELRDVHASETSVLGQVNLRPAAPFPKLSDAPSKPDADVTCHLTSMAISFGLNLASRLTITNGVGVALFGVRNSFTKLVPRLLFVTLSCNLALMKVKRWF